MRILVIAALAVGIVTGASAPALASPNIPVTVTGEPNNGICVTVSVSSPVTQCVDLGKP